MREEGGGGVLGLWVFVIWTRDGYVQKPFTRGFALDVMGRRHTSMSGNLASSPVMGSCAIEELHLAKARLLAREEPGCNLQRVAARRMERSVDDMAGCKGESKARWGLKGTKGPRGDSRRVCETIGCG